MIEIFIFNTLYTLETEFVRIEKLLKAKQLLKRKNIIIFSFCLLLSTFFWVTKKFSKEYQFQLPVQISFKNLPDNKIVLYNTDTTILLDVKTQGFNLLFYKFFRKNKKTEINFNSLNSFSKDGYVYIKPDEIINSVKKDIYNGFTVIENYKDAFKFKYVNSYSKKVAIKLQLQIRLRNQYFLYNNITPSPDSVIITGYKNTLDEISFLNTRPVIMNDLYTSGVVYADIAIPDVKPKIITYTKRVNLKIDVEKYTENELEVAVNVKSINQQKNIRLFPEKVKVSYLVAIKDYKDIKSEAFNLFVNIDNLSEINSNKVEIEIGRIPPKIKLKKIYPENVEFIIFK